MFVSTLAQENAGKQELSAHQPFTIETVAPFNTPWAVAVLPDQRLVVTEKAGKIFVVNREGEKREVGGVPQVLYSGQNGLLDIAPSPHFKDDHTLYFTFVEPGKDGGGLALARAILKETGGIAALEDLAIIWRQEPKGSGGQPGGIIAFSPDGAHLFLSSGDRMRPETAQDRQQVLGKIIRLLPDGTTPPDNPFADKGGVAAQIWTLGHRNPYGLAFAPDGELWSHEMGPRGGDELNRIQVGRNYGWPEVSNGSHYTGWPIPDHDTRPEFEAPALFWTPVIAPAGLHFYRGDLFPEWKGSALIGGLRAQVLVRVTVDKAGKAHAADRWDMKARIRDVTETDDGAVWVITDSAKGSLLRLVPASR